MTFAEAEAHYATLVQKWRNDAISADAFERAVAELRVEYQGEWYTLRGSDGRWLRYDGARWVQSARPQIGAAASSVVDAPPADRPKGRGCLRTCLLLVLLFGCGIAALAGAGYFAYRQSAITPMQLQTRLQGSAELSFVNASDDRARLTLTQLGGEGSEMPGVDDLGPFEVGGYAGLPAGRYRLTVDVDGDLPADVTCDLTIGRNDIYQFVLVQQGLALTREDYETTEAREINAATSSLCQG